jgi:hypothetical protein
VHVKRILVLFSLATATLTAGSWFFVRQRLKNSRDSVARIQFIERIRGFVKGSISVPKGAKSYFLGQIVLFVFS